MNPPSLLPSAPASVTRARTAALLISVLGLLAEINVCWAQPAVAPTIEDFFREPDFSQPALSPNGKLIAALATGAGGKKQLVVIDPADLGKSRVVAGLADADVDRFQWISDRRVVFQAVDLSSGGGNQFAPGLFAVDADGSDYRQLVDRNWRGVITAGRRLGDRSLPWNTFLVGPTTDLQSDDVFVEQIPWDPTRNRPGDELQPSILYRLNTRSGELVNLSLGAPSGTGPWLVGDDGLPRMRIIARSGQVTVHYRDPQTGSWRILAEFQSLSGQGFIPVRVRRDGTILVSSSGGRDTRALFAYDPVTARLDPEPVIAVKGFDFEGVPIWDLPTDRLLGVHVNADGAGTVWLDPRMQEIQKVVDAALPRTVNRISVPPRPATPILLVQSFSDTQPPIYFIFNSETRKLIRFASSRPPIDPALLGATSFVRIKARDGLSVPVYYTQPKLSGGKLGLPTVVWIHGGPWVRGRRWGWDSEAQFLASRGYLVIEPEFRGSTGYGFSHFKAGWKQWGQAMQDDVTDATQWAIDKGLADPKRICVAGASYGGYATLMALAREPGVFKCGIAWLAVTDLSLMFTARWTDVTESARRYGLRTLVGDPEKEGAHLRSVSPLTNASRIKQPLLLAYGGSDLRVPIEHGKRFRDELALVNPTVDWVVYGDEGHGWLKLETRVDFWGRVEKFLAANLAAGN